MAKSDTDEAESLKIIISEQKNDSDYLLHIYDRMRATEALLLTAGFGVLIYMYYRIPESVENGLQLTFSQRIAFPDQDYGRVIYVLAAIFFFSAVIKLMFNVCGYNPWETTYEREKTDYTTKSLNVLRYYKKRYDHCIEKNGKQYGKRKRELSWLFFCLLISAIILIVIKTLK
jgi:hypothetical protein